jgi:hypothetical protein
VQNNILASTGIDFEKMGFVGLPKHLTYFNLEVKPDKPVVITVSFYPTESNFDFTETKKYNLVEISDVSGIVEIE